MARGTRSTSSRRRRVPVVSHDDVRRVSAPDSTHPRSGCVANTASAFGQSNPWLHAARPVVRCRLQPRRIIQRSTADDANHSGRLRAWPRVAEQPRPAVRADPSALDTAAFGDAARDGYRGFSRHRECLVGDNNADGESTARNALTVCAVARVDFNRRPGDRVADRAADAASRQWQLHGSPGFVVRVKLRHSPAVRNRSDAWCGS